MHPAMSDPPTSPDGTQDARRLSAGARRHLPALALFLLLTLAYTHPLVLNLTQGTLTQALGLNYALMSNAALIGEGLTEGTGILSPARIFFPVGYTIHEGLLPSLLVFILGGGRDFLLGLNLSILLSFVLTAWAAYLLAVELTGSRWGGIAAGLYFGFGSHHLGNVGLYPMFHLQWMVLFFWTVVRHLRYGRWPSLLGVAVFFAAASLSSWYFSVLIGATLILVLPISSWKLGRWRSVLQIGGVLAVTALLLIPLNPVMLLGSEGVASGGFRFVVDGSADLLSFVTPHSEHWYLWHWSRSVQEDWLGNRGLQMNYLGSLSLLLCLAGVVAWRGSRWVCWTLAATASMFLVLSLGPYLAVDGLPGFSVQWPVEGLNAIRMPFYWLSDQFPFRSTRAVSRYSMVSALVLSVFLAAAVAALIRRRPLWLRASGVGLVSLVLGLEFLPVWPIPLIEPVERSQFHRSLPPPPVGMNRSVAELPFRSSSYRMLYYATAHRWNVVGGAVDKPFARFEAQARRRPLLRRMALLSAGNPNQATLNDVFGGRWLEYGAAEAADLGLEYAVVHRYDENILSFGPYFVEEPRIGNAENAITPWYEPVHEDRLIRAYRIREFPQRWVYPIVGGGFGRMEDHGRYVDRAMLGSHGVLDLRASHDGRVNLELDLALILVPERTVVISLNGEPVLTRQIPRRREPGQSVQLSMNDIPVRAGSNRLELSTPEPVPSVAEVHRGTDHRRIAFLLSRIDVAYAD